MSNLCHKSASTVKISQAASQDEIKKKNNHLLGGGYLLARFDKHRLQC